MFAFHFLYDHMATVIAQEVPDWIQQLNEEEAEEQWDGRVWNWVHCIAKGGICLNRGEPDDLYMSCWILQALYQMQSKIYCNAEGYGFYYGLHTSDADRERAIRKSQAYARRREIERTLVPVKDWSWLVLPWSDRIRLPAVILSKALLFAYRSLTYRALEMSELHSVPDCMYVIGHDCRSLWSRSKRELFSTTSLPQAATEELISTSQLSLESLGTALRAFWNVRLLRRQTVDTGRQETTQTRVQYIVELWRRMNTAEQTGAMWDQMSEESSAASGPRSQTDEEESGSIASGFTGSSSSAATTGGISSIEEDDSDDSLCPSDDRVYETVLFSSMFLRPEAAVQLVDCNGRASAMEKEGLHPYVLSAFLYNACAEEIRMRHDTSDYTPIHAADAVLTLYLECREALRNPKHPFHRVRFSDAALHRSAACADAYFFQGLFVCLEDFWFQRSSSAAESFDYTGQMLEFFPVLRRKLEQLLYEESVKRFLSNASGSITRHRLRIARLLQVEPFQWLEHNMEQTGEMSMYMHALWLQYETVFRNEDRFQRTDVDWMFVCVASVHDLRPIDLQWSMALWRNEFGPDVFPSDSYWIASLSNTWTVMLVHATALRRLQHIVLPRLLLRYRTVPVSGMYQVTSVQVQLQSTALVQQFLSETTSAMDRALAGRALADLFLNSRQQRRDHVPEPDDESDPKRRRVLSSSTLWSGTTDRPEQLAEQPEPIRDVTEWMPQHHRSRIDGVPFRHASCGRPTMEAVFQRYDRVSPLPTVDDALGWQILANLLPKVLHSLCASQPPEQLLDYERDVVAGEACLDLVSRVPSLYRILYTLFANRARSYTISKSVTWDLLAVVLQMSTRATKAERLQESAVDAQKRSALWVYLRQTVDAWTEQYADVSLSEELDRLPLPVLCTYGQWAPHWLIVDFCVSRLGTEQPLTQRVLRSLRAPLEASYLRRGKKGITTPFVRQENLTVSVFNHMERCIRNVSTDLGRAALQVVSATYHRLQDADETQCGQTFLRETTCDLMWTELMPFQLFPVAPVRTGAFSGLDPEALQTSLLYPCTNIHLV